MLLENSLILLIVPQAFIPEAIHFFIDFLGVVLTNEVV